MLAACCGPVRAGDAQPGDAPPGEVPGDGASEAARTLVDEVLRKAGGDRSGDDLGEWTRSMIERALERASGAAEETPAPLPAERHAARTAAGLAGRPNSADIIVFTSLSVPAPSWRQWSREAARIGVPLVLRGVGEGGMRATVKRIGARIGAHKVGVAIDPRLFRLFGIERVPAVVVAPGGRAGVHQPGLLGRRGSAPRRHRREYRSRRRIGGNRRRGRARPGPRAADSGAAERRSG